MGLTSTFLSGTSELKLEVNLVDDSIFEGNESFSVQFSVVGSQSVEADPLRESATVTISDAEDSKLDKCLSARCY